MTGLSLNTAPLEPDALYRRVFDGEILVFRGIAAMAALLADLRAHLAEHLGAVPESVHERLDADTLGTALATLRGAVRADDRVAAGIRAALAEAGLEPDDTFDDGLQLRMQAPNSAGGARGVAPLEAHRDTWGTNVMAQVNWWAPIHPTTVERTIALFPAWFRRPVPNDSAGWDFAELVRRLKAEGDGTGYPLLPTATAPPARHDALALSVEPGDLVAFSGAHLHASVPNATGRTRLSLEIRTASAAESAAGRGAPNVDGEAPRTTWQLFRHPEHGRLGAMD